MMSLLDHNLDLHDPFLRQVPFVIVTVSRLQFLSRTDQAKEMSKFWILMCAALPVEVACPLSSSMQKTMMTAVYLLWPTMRQTVSLCHQSR